MRRDSHRPGLTRRQAIGILGGCVGTGVAATLRGTATAAAQTTFRSVQRITVPRGAVIRTILKDLPPDALVNGATLIHEHLGTDVELMVEELKGAAAEGLGCMVNATTGRRTDEQVNAVKRIAERSPVQIVLAGGHFQDSGFAKYPPDIATMSESQIVDELVADAARQRWGAMGEIGSSLQMQPDERKVLR